MTPEQALNQLDQVVSQVNLGRTQHDQLVKCTQVLINSLRRLRELEGDSTKPEPQKNGKPKNKAPNRMKEAVDGTS